MAEVMALHHGIQLAIQDNITHLHIQVDNVLVVNALKGCRTPPWQMCHLFKNIHQLLHILHHVGYQECLQGS